MFHIKLIVQFITKLKSGILPYFQNGSLIVPNWTQLIINFLLQTTLLTYLKIWQIRPGLTCVYRYVQLISSVHIPTSANNYSSLYKECFLSNGYRGPFTGVKARWGVTLTTHPLVPRSWMSRSYTFPPPWASIGVLWNCFTFTLYIKSKNTNPRCEWT
jgi:hypothetical protein